MNARSLWLFCFVVLSTSVFAVENTNELVLTRAKVAFDDGHHEEGIKLATQAIESEPKNPRGYFVRARLREENGEPAKAVLDYDEVLKLDPTMAEAWQHRGSEHFKLGHIQESISDFDKFIDLIPEQAPYHWQRGISYYYAGRFKEGRQQFELHQTVNPNDVENAVWHFLCASRESGVEKARSTLIPIKGDARIPMMKVHALFGGHAKPDDVLQVASQGQSKSEVNRQLFYAHLYLGLYFESLGDKAKAREHIEKAAGTYRTDDYMGDVARVHLQLRSKAP